MHVMYLTEQMNFWVQQPQDRPVPEPESRTPEPSPRAPLMSQCSGSHSGDSSSGGRADHAEHAAQSQGQGLRASNSGEHEGLSQRGLSIKKSTGERDKNKVAQRNFRQRKKEREKAKYASSRLTDPLSTPYTMHTGACCMPDIQCKRTHVMLKSICFGLDSCHAAASASTRFCFLFCPTSTGFRCSHERGAIVRSMASCWLLSLE